LPVTRSATSDSTQLSELMAVTLSAQLEERIASDLVADIVKGVLDESATALPDRAVESAMLEARQRLERFIRAGAATVAAPAI